MKGYKVRRNINNMCMFVAITFLWGAFALAQEKVTVLSEFKPTLSGHKNYAFIKTDTVGKDRKVMVVFWRKNEPNYKLVAAQGGMFWGNNAGVEIGINGEKITFGEANVAIDGDSQYIGNLDYEGSTYTFIGTVRLLKHTFSSKEEDPLIFTLVKDKGFVYVKGKGTILTEMGDKIKFE